MKPPLKQKNVFGKSYGSVNLLIITHVCINLIPLNDEKLPMNERAFVYGLGANVIDRVTGLFLVCTVTVPLLIGGHYLINCVCITTAIPIITSGRAIRGTKKR